jgi:type IV secretory pathway TrbD component
LWLATGHARGEPGQGSFDIDNLAGLRAGDHVLEIGILINGAGRIVALFNFTLSAALLLILLLLFAGLLAAAFFQLAILITVICW